VRVISGVISEDGSEPSKELLDTIEREVKVYKTLQSNIVKSMFVFTDKKLTV